MLSTALYINRKRPSGLLLIFLLALAGCTLPRPNAAVVMHDLGPGALHSMTTNRMTLLPALELAPVQANVALGSTAMLYRLAYADIQQPRAYALARWSVPPAQLIDQRLREQLGQIRSILAPGDVVPPRPAATSASAPVAIVQPMRSLRVNLEEFSQLFEAADKSSALLRMRATVLQRSAAGDVLLAQRSFVVQHRATTPDVRGGVQALTMATDQAIAELEDWLMQMPH